MMYNYYFSRDLKCENILLDSDNNIKVIIYKILYNIFYWICN